MHLDRQSVKPLLSVIPIYITSQVVFKIYTPHNIFYLKVIKLQFLSIELPRTKMHTKIMCFCLVSVHIYANDDKMYVEFKEVTFKSRKNLDNGGFREKIHINISFCVYNMPNATQFRTFMA